MDKDGYPEEHELKKIEEWDYHDFEGLMTYVRDLWKYKHYFRKKIGEVYDLSTGGWSGNESIIAALEQNRMFWAIAWQESKRGGHFIFEIRKVKDGSKL